MWALGEYDRIADGLTVTTDHTMRVARVRPGEMVLDVATGTGITAIAAREHGATVTAIDLTPELIEVAKVKAREQGFDDIDFRVGDAEALPFPDASFDVVLSTCGHMFAPDQPKVGSELMRVTRPGGRVVFLAWTPDGGLGGWFRTTNKHVAPNPAVPPPFNWGDMAKVKELLGDQYRDISFARGDSTQYGESAEDIWNLFSLRYGPTVRALSTLTPDAQLAMRNDHIDYLNGYRTAADGKIRWGREYLITRAIRK